MPLLGIFHRRDKQKSSRSAQSNFSADAESATTRSTTPPDTDYVLPDTSTPTRANGHNIYANPAAPASSSSSFIKMPFRRKRRPDEQQHPSGLSVMSLNDENPPTRPPKTSWMSNNGSVVSDSDAAELRRPPKKSAVFGEPHSAMSTRSLPVEAIEGAGSKNASTSPTDKKSGLLFWAQRQRTKSKPTSPPPRLPSPTPTESFNLKAFRHVGPESSGGSQPNTSPTLTRPPSAMSVYSLSPPQPPPPVGRPRGDSTTSNDSSQRISVAAFREAQARRSANNSPIPSFRPPSSADTLTPQSRPGSRAAGKVLTPVSARDGNARRSTAPVSVFSAGSTSSESESEESESDNEAPRNAPVRRKRTITQRTQSQSELGHGALRPTRPTVSTNISSSRSTHELRTPDSGNRDSRPPDARPVSGFSVYGQNRQRASASASALAPNKAAQRASIIAAANAQLAASAPKPIRRGTDTDSSESSTDSEEDAPLATLVQPKRPGSALSVLTNGTSALKKPLVDIKSVIEGKDRVAFTRRESKNSESGGLKRSSASRSSKKGKGRKESKDDEDDRRAGSSSTARPGMGHRRTSSDVMMSAASMQNDLGDPGASSSGIRLVNPRDAVAFHEATSGLEPRFVPTPIQQRPPPSAFSVTSRPRPSPSSSSASTTSAAKSSAAPPTKQRSSTLEPSSFDYGPSPTLSKSRDEYFPRERNASGSPTTANQRPRSVTLNSPAVSSPQSMTSPSTSASNNSPDTSSARPRSSTHISPLNTSHSNSPGQSSNSSQHASSNSRTLLSMISPTSSAGSPTAKPWSARRESPASSTGDSSSGRLPLTPRDGSELSYGTRDNSGGRGSELGNRLVSGEQRRYTQKTSVDAYGNAERDRGRDRGSGRERSEKETYEADESRRRERRRSEAKNAIELGKVVNGAAPEVSDDESRHPSPNVSPQASLRASMAPPMINFNSPPMPPWNAYQQNSPQMMGTPPAHMMGDPNFLAAHQQAMLIAKQAYQYAVAQQALAAAGDEWERGSSVSGFGGGAAGGGGGYFGAAPFGGMGMPGMGGMGPGGGWSPGPMMFPGASRSMYGGSSVGGAGSEYGGGWGSASAYGDAFGPSQPGDRSSMAFRQQPQSQHEHRQSQVFPPRPHLDQRSETLGVPSTNAGNSARPGPRPRTNTAPGNSQTQTTQHARGTKAPPPPSSWKRQAGI